MVNRFLMAIEDILFPGIDEYAKEVFTQPNKLVFILGHQRSGTTNVHKALSSINGVTTGTQFDLIFPSLILKYVFSHLASGVNWLFFRQVVQAEISNHKFGVFEELEEHLLMLHYFGGEVISTVLFPFLGENSNFLEQAIKIEPHHMKFTRRCIARTLYFQRKPTSAYVGCPLGFSLNPALLRKHFPFAKIIVCARDPVRAFPSFVDLIRALTKAPLPYDEKFVVRINVLYNIYSTRVYQSLSDFPGDKHTMWLDFENWKKNAPRELEWLWACLGWKPPQGASKIALERSESHSNCSESFLVVPRHQIQKDLDVAFKKLRSKCVRTI